MLIQLHVLVYRPGRIDETACDETNTGSSGTITCNLTGYTGQALIRVYTSKSPSSPFFAQWEYIVAFADSFGITGQIVGAFIMIAVAMVGLATPTVSIVLMPIALIFIAAFGLISIPMAIIIYFIVLAIIILIQIRK